MRLKNVFVALAMASLAAAAPLAGCGGDDDDDGATGQPTGGEGGGDPATCEPTSAVCTAVGSDCLAIQDNAGKTTFGLRMAQLLITKPTVLATGYVAELVGKGVWMNLGQCNLPGTGTFSWLLEFDTTTGKLRTGGALPQPDPSKGYCFLQQTVDQFEIQPTEVDAPLVDGKASADVGDLVVPIFLAVDSPTPIILPLHQTRLTDVTVSADNNCIGQYNSAQLQPDNLCQPDAEHPPFVNAAKLDAYITLDEADQVIVEDIGQSLCVILSGDPSKYGNDETPKRCKRDADNAIELQGDWCAGDNAAATPDCHDAFALGGEFAASAVQITGLCP